ncbi:hypothetical protein KEM55_009367 [Ascosphaera atra]|nr:hypothetical protein KEM55_009367 [Ascosphaera atra]
MGFTYSPFDPAKRFMRGPSSTAEAQSPGSADISNVHRVRRLIRGASKPNTRNEDGEKGSSTNSDAFAMMRRAMKRKKTKEAFIRDKSNAKEIVDEVAEESDDEYAGLGGRSDDSEGEEDEIDRQMIDDDAEDIDEEAHAALNA